MLRRSTFIFTKLPIPSVCNISTQQILCANCKNKLQDFQQIPNTDKLRDSARSYMIDNELQKLKMYKQYKHIDALVWILPYVFISMVIGIIVDVSIGILILSFGLVKWGNLYGFIYVAVFSLFIFLIGTLIGTLIVDICYITNYKKLRR